MSRGETATEFFVGTDELAGLMRACNWSETPLGPPENWPQSLKTVVRIMLTSRFAMWMGWGDELTFFYNDAYAPTLGIKHPWALGKSARDVWAEIWADIGPRIDTVLESGVATWDEALMLFLERSGFPEETYHTFSYSPLANDEGTVTGMLCVVSEETERVIGERRLALLRELASELAGVNQEEDVYRVLVSQAEARPQDLPFALLYQFVDDETAAVCVAACGDAIGSQIAPQRIEIGDPASLWPADEVLRLRETVRVRDIETRAPGAPCGPWDRPVREAILVPISQPGQSNLAGFLVAGINPYRPFDAEYAGFVDLLTGQIASAIGKSRAYEVERRRAEELAKLDRAKTAFFSNVSHELRTPLTLMIGPLEDALADDSELQARTRGDLEVAHRNALRLLKLVNTLLDFSRLEAGRARAQFRPVDLATFTTELASGFRSAIERAGLRLCVDCPPIPESVYVDPEMWEKIVLNLLSNALKYTFRGEIDVSLRSDGEKVTLAVRDTGTGISTEDQERLFERFYRVEGARGRTHEGTGIGLALVQELVTMHGGHVEVTSEVGVGSQFSVTVPLGVDHLPADRIGNGSVERSRSLSTSFLQETDQWVPRANAADEIESIPDENSVQNLAPEGARILIADDNADMRSYLHRLLAGRYEVESVEDGSVALEVARREPPDLILTDVMMPRLDGFGLIAAIRSDTNLRDVPVIMLSARAGDEAKVEGLIHGADDYLVKPFSARELVARVQSNLKLAEIRRESTEREIRLRRDAEQARLRLETVLRDIRDQFIVTDRDGQILFVSDSVLEVSGLGREQLLTRSLLDTFPELRESNFESALQSVIRTHEPAQATLFYAPHGRWYDNRLSPTSDGGVAILSMDITDRIAAEAALRTSETRLRRFAESLPQIAWECRADGSVIWFNSRFYDYTGLTEDQALGAGWLDVFHHEDRPATVRRWAETVRTGTAFSAEARVRSRTGEMRWWLVQCLPVRDPGGTVDRWYGSGTDIHDQKELEHELERRVAERTADLTEANREMEGFTYTVSHDLRAPLRAIEFSSSILLDEAGEGLTTVHRELLVRQSAGARKLAALIDDLLRLSRVSRQAMNWSEVDLTSMALEVFADIRHHQPTTAEFIVAEGLHTKADPQLIRFVLLNLLQNAVKFSPSGGTIEFGERGGAFFVRDQGIGFDPTYSAKIFEPFERLVSDVEFTGTGVGLANVKRIVERHRGQVWAESSPGQGSTFWFTIRGPNGV